ncbi:hypothetical protein CMV_027293 [Castanea mollissima]|uniref:H15 domain-containing protein n=1 Tax=Castanea mollissima TaxID=60419 RepID=A0A8J4V2W2_9ROSI|nr:hypothetical protein CMV_027293 [Castanea mollissima]
MAYTSRAQPSADVPSRAEHSDDADEADPSHRLLSCHTHRLSLPSTHTHQLSLPHHKILSHSLPLPPPYPFIFPHHTHTHTHSDFAWLDKLILEAITNLNEPRGSDRAAIALYIEA